MDFHFRHFITAHASTRKTIRENDGLCLISSSLVPFTSHAVELEAIGILVKLEYNSKFRSISKNPMKVSLVVDILNEGTTETKMNGAKLIQMLTKRIDSKS